MALSIENILKDNQEKSLQNARDSFVADTQGLLVIDPAEERKREEEDNIILENQFHDFLKIIESLITTYYHVRRCTSYFRKKNRKRRFFLSKSMPNFNFETIQL